MQASRLIGDNQWSQAISLYERGGEQPPNSAVLADIYNDWGESLIRSWGGSLDRKSDFNMAIDKFRLVITGFTGVAAEVTRAETATAQAYLRIGQAYLDAGTTFQDRYVNL